MCCTPKTKKELAAKKLAIENLSALRSGSYDYEKLITQIKNRAKKYISLSEIGTSTEEINRLRDKGRKMLAEKYLEELRANPNPNNPENPNYYDERNAQENLKKIQHISTMLYFEDIGTDRDELKKLSLASRKFLADKFLGGQFDKKELVEFCQELLEKYKLSAE